MSAVPHIYIDAYVDEGFCPAHTLEGWAKWLADPSIYDGSEWARKTPATHGEQFTASRMDVSDILAVRKDDGTWDHDPPPRGADFFVPRFAPGKGWDAEYSSDDLQHVLKAEADDHNDEVLIACGVSMPSMLLEYRVDENGVPSLVVISTEQ